jgi:hypothetical protein
MYLSAALPLLVLLQVLLLPALVLLQAQLLVLLQVLLLLLYLLLRKQLLWIYLVLATQVSWGPIPVLALLLPVVPLPRPEVVCQYLDQI